MDPSLKNILIETAMKSNLANKYACAITLRDKIIAVGYNSYKPHNKGIFLFNNDYESNKHSIHAEKAAIRKVRNKNILTKCKIYIIKLRNTEIEPGIPCPMCYKLLEKYKINKIN